VFGFAGVVLCGLEFTSLAGTMDYHVHVFRLGTFGFGQGDSKSSLGHFLSPLRYVVRSFPRFVKKNICIFLEIVKHFFLNFHKILLPSNHHIEVPSLNNLVQVYGLRSSVGRSKRPRDIV
jgi:hypothetical protein